MDERNTGSSPFSEGPAELPRTDPTQGEIVSEVLDHDGDRKVTVHVPTQPAEAIVFAGERFKKTKRCEHYLPSMQVVAELFSTFLDRINREGTTTSTRAHSQSDVQSFGEATLSATKTPE